MLFISLFVQTTVVILVITLVSQIIGKVCIKDISDQDF